MTCPDYERLFLALADRTLDPEVHRHLAEGCPRCAGRIRLGETALQALLSGGLPAPREDWKKAAAELPGRPDLRLPTRWTGTEVVDRGPTPVLRGGALCQRHLRFEAGPAELDLALLEPATLVGTVTRHDDRELGRDAVCVLDGSRGTRQMALEPNGDFRFEGVDPGHYLLLVEGGDWNLVVKDVDLTSEVGDR